MVTIYRIATTRLCLVSVLDEELSQLWSTLIIMDRVTFDNVYEEVDLDLDDHCSCPNHQNGAPSSASAEQTKQQKKPRRLTTKSAFYMTAILFLIVAMIYFSIHMFCHQERNISISSKSKSIVPAGTIAPIMTGPSQQPSPTLQYQNDPEIKRKRLFIKNMFLDSWNAYVKYAWGHESIKPISKSVFEGLFGNNSGLNIVSAMSTLWIMDLKEEFQRGKEWIEIKLDLSKLAKDVMIFEAITYYVGGLLSCFSLSNDTMFMDHATKVATLMEPAFNTSTGL